MRVLIGKRFKMFYLGTYYRLKAFYHKIETNGSSGQVGLIEI
jgi:hypothetical protein